MERSSRIRPTNVSCPNPNNGGTEEEGEELGIERDRARAAEVDEDVQDAGAAGKRGAHHRLL